MKVEMLDTLTDAQLTEVIARSNELLIMRDRQRKDDAIEKARTLLAAAGLSFKDIAGKKASRAASVSFRPKSGHTYQHPDNPTLQCLGTGNKPKWWHELAKAGREPIDLGAVKKMA